MSDRELLELAAKAAGIVSNGWHPAGGVQYRDEGGQSSVFDPLNRDGDAFRLAVKLRIDLSLWFMRDSVTAKTHIGAGRGIPLHGEYKPPRNDHIEPFGSDPYVATRRAIVRAAAEIGRGLASDPSKRG